MLEALVSPSASFITLTYDEESLPPDGSLRSRDLQLFIKRLRHYAKRQIRYFACGEYGDLTMRPHYHAALFNVQHTEQNLIDIAWGLGRTSIAELTMERANYVAGYVTKKMTDANDDRLQGRTPEFARMSLRPGIGSPSVQQIADALSSRNGWDEIDRLGDVPTVLRHGPSNYPLGRYLRQKLREAMSFDVESVSKEQSLKQSQEMLALFEDHVASSKHPKQTLKGMLDDLNRQKIRNLETRQKIYSIKGHL